VVVGETSPRAGRRRRAKKGGGRRMQSGGMEEGPHWRRSTRGGHIRGKTAGAIAVSMKSGKGKTFKRLGTSHSEERLSSGGSKQNPVSRLPKEEETSQVPAKGNHQREVQCAGHRDRKTSSTKKRGAGAHLLNKQLRKRDGPSKRPKAIAPARKRGGKIPGKPKRENRTWEGCRRARPLNS